ncbi:hypothetical protein ACU686_43825 [Yinghuangia aomiensis]
MSGARKNPGARRFRRLGGLRLRLVVAFVLVAAFASLVTAALTYREARAGLLQRSQDRIVGDLRTLVNTTAPSIPFPPDQAVLDATAHSIDKQVGTGGVDRHRRVPRPPGRSGLRMDDIDIPASLRASVDNRTATVFQRFSHKGKSGWGSGSRSRSRPRRILCPPASRCTCWPRCAPRRRTRPRWSRPPAPAPCRPCCSR